MTYYAIYRGTHLRPTHDEDGLVAVLEERVRGRPGHALAIRAAVARGAHGQATSQELRPGTPLRPGESVRDAVRVALALLPALAASGVVFDE